MNYDKDIIVNVPTQELSRAVQEQFFHNRIPWIGGSFAFDMGIVESYGEISCLRYSHSERSLSFGHSRFYREAYSGVTIISAEEFLAVNIRQVMFLEPKEVT